MTAITNRPAPVNMGRYTRRTDPHETAKREADLDLKMTLLEIKDLESRKTELVAEIAMLNEESIRFTTENKALALTAARLREQVRLTTPARTLSHVIEEGERVRRQAVADHPEHEWLGPRRLALAADEIAEHNKRCEKCITESKRRSRKGANTK